MDRPFRGSELTRSGVLTKGDLARSNTRLMPDVYVTRHTEVTAVDRAIAGWEWSKRRGVVAGFSAAALLGSDWVDAGRPAEIIHDNRHRLRGVLVHTSALADDEVQLVDGIPVTTPARTALDLACWYPMLTAVPALDALARATGFTFADVTPLLERYQGRRGLREARESLDLVDTGAQSPQESRLRVVLVRAKIPRPETQIRVYDEYTGGTVYLDMGWRDLQVSAEYDGDQHRTDLRQWRSDPKRRELILRNGWNNITVVAGDRDADVIRRVQAARARRLSADMRRE